MSPRLFALRGSFFALLIWGAYHLAAQSEASLSVEIRDAASGGIIPAMVIQALLGDLKAQDVFHIIAGTSTGGIIACGLAKPDPIDLQDIIDLYVKHGSEIFKKVLGYNKH